MRTLSLVVLAAVALGACAKAPPYVPPTPEEVRARLDAQSAEFSADFEKRKPYWLQDGYRGPIPTPAEAYAEAGESWRRDPPSETVRNMYAIAGSRPTPRPLVVVVPVYVPRHYHHHHHYKHRR